MDDAPDASKARYQLVVIGASAGGIQALKQLVADLPAGFPLPVVVVQHLDPTHRSLLVEILAKRTSLHVAAVEEGASMDPGTIQVAPPGTHVLVRAGGTLALSSAEPVHHVRPSADVLFASAAESLGAAVIAVVLSGTGEDGASGVQAVKAAGGTVLAQNEASSEFYGMPGAAVDTGAVDEVLPLAEIGSKLASLATAGSHGGAT